MHWWRLKQLKSADTKKRKQAAHKLGESKDVRAVESLMAAVADEDASVRVAAVEALGRIGDARAIESLMVAALTDEDASVQRLASQVLKRPDWDPADDEQRAWLAVAQEKWDEAASLRAAAVRPFTAALHYDKSPETRWRAAKALGEIGDQLGASGLHVALQDKSEDVSRTAAWALAQIGAPSVDLLITNLLGENKNVRKLAREALVKIGAPSVKPLIDVLREQNVNARKRAVEALIEIGASSVDPLIDSLRDEDKVRWSALGADLFRLWSPPDVTKEVRWNAAYALGQIRDERAVFPLVTALQDQDTGVRKCARDALRHIGSEPLIAALRDEDIGIRVNAAWGLGEIREAGAVQPLIAALRDESGYVCLIVAYALGKIGDARALDELERIAQVDDEYVAGPAREAAKEIREHQQKKLKEQNDY